MTSLHRAPSGRRLAPAGAVLLTLVLAGCGGSPSPSSSEEATTTTTAGAAEPSAAPATAGSAATAAPQPSGTPPGNDVAPYDETATREAAGTFGTPQRLTDFLEAAVEGPRPGTTGQRPVRAAPGTPVQVFTLTLTNTGAAPVDAAPWSFPVAVADGEPAVPVFDESLGVRMETFPGIAPGESASLTVAFDAAPGTDLAVRVFDNTDPGRYAEFTD